MSIKDYSGLDQNEFIISVTINGINEKIYASNLKIKEQISDLYFGDLNFFLNNNSLDIEKLLGQNILITISLKKKIRTFSGIIFQVESREKVPKDDIFLNSYNVQFSHEIIKLKLSKNSRIFQNKTPKEIISEILDNNKIKNMELNLIGSVNEKIEYFVQYEESDFDFISRLMEFFGVFYFFSYDENDIKIIISNAANSYLKFNFDNKIPMDYATNLSSPPIAKMKIFKEIGNLKNNQYSTKSYNYEKPESNLFISDNSIKSNEEYYEWNNYKTKTEGEKILKLRNDLNDNSVFNYYGESEYPFLSAGYIFQLSDNVLNQLNKLYLVTNIEHEFKVNNWNGGIVANYQNSMQAIEKAKTYLPDLKTKVPKIYGNILGVVTGPANKIIYKDELNRVKVYLFWDKDSKIDENSSCWIRSIEAFSGIGFGSVFTPRIGTEVVVGFLNGDPNQPYIIGTMYNEKNTPPFNNKNESIVGLRTRSFDNKNGFNELSFDDKSENELVYLKAEKDFKEDIKRNKNISIEKGNFETLIKEGDLDIVIQKGNGKTELKDGNYNIIVSDNLIIKAKKITFESKDDININSGGDLNIKAKNNISISANGNIKTNSLKQTNISSKSSIDIDALTNLNISSNTNMNLKSASLSLKTTMNLTISSNMNASINSNIALNLKASAINNISGAMIKLG